MHPSDIYSRIRQRLADQPHTKQFDIRNKEPKRMRLGCGWLVLVIVGTIIYIVARGL